MINYDECLPVDGSGFVGLDPGEVRLRAPTTPDGEVIYIGLDQNLVKEARKEELGLLIANDGAFMIITAMRPNEEGLQFGRPRKRQKNGWPDITPAFSRPVESIVYMDTPEGWVFRDDSGLITPDGYSIVMKAATVIAAAASRGQAKKQLHSAGI